MKRTAFALLLAGSLLTACTNRQSTPESTTEAKTGSPVEDSAGVEEEVPEAAPRTVLQQLPAVEQFFASQDPRYSAQNFEEGGVRELDSLQPASFAPEDIKPFRPYLVYNGDSSLAIDLYSYNVMLVQKGGRTVGEGTGPDAEVALLHLKNGTRHRLYFSGPSGAILDAQWINPREVAIVAGEITSPGKFQPRLLRIHTADRTVQTFSYRDTLNLKPSDYKGGKLAVQ